MIRYKRVNLLTYFFKDQNEIVAEFEDSVTLKLEGLPEDINEESLCRELAIYGPIASVKLVPGLGSALVAYMRPIDANTAREKITTMFGTMIYVSKWRPIRLPKDALYGKVLLFNWPKAFLLTFHSHRRYPGKGQLWTAFQCSAGKRWRYAKYLPQTENCH